MNKSDQGPNGLELLTLQFAVVDSEVKRAGADLADEDRGDVLAVEAAELRPGEVNRRERLAGREGLHAGRKAVARGEHHDGVGLALSARTLAMNPRRERMPLRLAWVAINYIIYII